MALTGSGVLVSQAMAVVETTQYTAPSTVGGNPLKLVTLKSATVTNTSTASICPVSLSILKSGQTVDGTHRVVSAYPLGPGDSATLPELVGVVLGPGDFLSAVASALVQTATITGGAGTFTLTYNGATTTSIAYNATAATVQTALTALSTIGANGVTVTGSAGGPYTVTFAGGGSALVPLMSGAGAGGASVAIAGVTSAVDLVVTGAVLS